jgi:hypothetical protein
LKELEIKSRDDAIQQSANNGSWTSFASSGASSSHQHHNGYNGDMPDVINDVQTMNLNRVDNFMDEEHGEDPMLSHINSNMIHQNTSVLDLDQLTHDPMLSASATLNLHQQQHSTVDMSSLDPIITNYGLLNMQHNSNCENASVDSILQSDSDSLINDIDMIA